MKLLIKIDNYLVNEGQFGGGHIRLTICGLLPISIMGEIAKDVHDLYLVNCHWSNMAVA